jgi:hypothetical protein
MNVDKDMLYLLNKQGSDLSGAPVKKFARQKCRMAHLTGLVYPPMIEKIRYAGNNG